MQIRTHTSPQLKQTVTTDLIQQLEMLQLSSIDLFAHIQEKVLENPLLEMNENRRNREMLRGTRMLRKECKQEWVSADDARMSLVEQIPLKRALTKKQEAIMKYLIECLDHHLFLKIEMEQVASKFSVNTKEIEQLICYLREFEPFGTGSFNSVDFMLRQIDGLTDSELARSFIQEELAAVARQDLLYLSSKYQVSTKEVQQTIQLIKQLQPFPINQNHCIQVPYIMEDAEITLFDGTLFIKMKNDWISTITLNKTNIELLMQSVDTKKYYKDCMRAAQQLLNGLEERKKTLYKLTEFLVKEQRLFFEKGLNYLKPLKLVDAASALHLHESTISRAIRDKYFIFQNKSYSYKSLFPKGMPSEDKQSVTSHVLKQKIRSLIDSENGSNPLSDQQIVNLLLKDNVKIARRTVTKYREEMLIPSSMNRRVIK